MVVDEHHRAPVVPRVCADGSVGHRVRRVEVELVHKGLVDHWLVVLLHDHCEPEKQINSKMYYTHKLLQIGKLRDIHIKMIGISRRL